MFTIDPNITAVQLKEKDLYKALFSLNNHEVATPDMSLEEARSFVFFFREGKSRLSVYIGLHLIPTDRKLFYTNSANPFLEDVLPDIEDEARNFAEGLGALLDEVDFAKMSDSEKSEWIDGQSIFGQKKEPEPAPAVPPASVEQSQPIPAAAPAPQPIAVPVPPAAPIQTVPASPAMPLPPAAPVPQPTAVPVPPASPVQAVPAPEPATVPTTPESPVPDMTTSGQQSVESQVPAAAPLAAAAKKRQDIMDKAVKAGVTKPPKQPLARELSTSTSVVSRDREALARLLTSF
jgi:hypothetical protein